LFAGTPTYGYYDLETAKNPDLTAFFLFSQVLGPRLESGIQGYIGVQSMQEMIS